MIWTQARTCPHKIWRTFKRLLSLNLSHLSLLPPAPTCTNARLRTALTSPCILLALLLLLPSLAHSRDLRVGYDPNYGIIEFKDGPQASGYSYEYLQRLSEFTGWNYTYVSCNWIQCLRMLEEGEIDLLPGMQRSDARKNLFDFGQYQEGFLHVSLVTRTDRNDVFYNDPQGYRNLTVVMAKDNAINTLFENYATENSLKVERILVESAGDMLALLQKGQADMAVISTPMDVRGLKEVANLGQQPFYTGLAHNVDGLRDEFDKAQWLLEKEDTYYNARLHERHLAQRSPPLGLSRAEAAFAAGSPSLRVAINPHWWPMESFTTPTSPTPTGILYDLLTKLSQEMGLNIVYVNTKNYAESLELFKRGEVDIITGLSDNMRNVLGDTAHISRPLLNMPLILVGRDGGAHSSTCKVGVPRYFASVKELRANFGPRAVHYNEFEDIATDLVQGRLNLAVMSSWRYDNVISLPGFSNLRVLGVLTRDAEVSLGVSTHVSPELLSLLNKSLLRITTEDVQSAVFTHTVGKSPASYWLLMWRAYGSWMALALVLALLIGVSLALYSKIRSARRLRAVALTDELTGIGNYKAFVLRGKPLQRKGNCLLVSMDINNFKNFNAYYGHQAGNVILIHTAQLLRLLVQDNEIACRTGGDEFSMLLQWPGSLEAVFARLEPLEDQLAALATSKGQQRLKLSYSFGVYRLPNTGVSLQAALDCGGEARKSVKEAYKTTIGVYDAAMDKRISDERLFEEEMLGAHERGEFVVRLQPKCDLNTGEIVGAEALVRWEHPQRGEILPGAFVSLFERNGFIARLDMFVLDTTCRMLRRWADECRPLMPISVNMSRLHVLDANFVSSVKRVIEQHGILPQLIELEVTESAFLENTDLLLHIMNELCDYGITLSMDDFGTGYSSLNMLKNLPVHVLKLDKEFLSSHADSSSRGRDIVRHVVSMAQALNMEVVCEGVETAGQVEFLRSIDCRIGQGYFFAKPMAIVAFEHMAFTQPQRAVPAFPTDGGSNYLM